MRVVSWNVNGIRTLNSVPSTVKDFEADVVCFQETKISRSDLDNGLAKIPGFYSFFNFSKVKEGYSGVATYVRDSACPYKVETQFFDSTDEPEDVVGDKEGRIMITYHNLTEGHLALINLYCPCAYLSEDADEDRFKYQLRFYKTLQRKVRTIMLDDLAHVIVIGDLNVKLHPIDSAEASEMSDFTDWYANPSRIWFKDFLEEDVIDTFRFLHPDKANAYSCWNTKMAGRVNNYGTRIDYVLVDNKLEDKIRTSDILSDIMGSDHCPVRCDIDLEFVKSEVVPQECTCFYPELKGKQQSIQMFAKRKLDSVDVSPFQVTASSSKKPKTAKTGLKQTSLSCFIKTAPKTNPKTLQQAIKTIQINKNPAKSEPPKNSPVKTSQPKSSPTKASQKSPSESLKSILSGLPKPPLCSGHQLPARIQTVKKDGPNKNRMFYCCKLPIGSSKDPNARCNFFKWK